MSRQAGHYRVEGGYLPYTTVPPHGPLKSGAPLDLLLGVFSKVCEIIGRLLATCRKRKIHNVFSSVCISCLDYRPL